MGHHRLGDIPKSQTWTNVVASVAADGPAAASAGVSSESVAQIAERTLDAAQAGLARAIDDTGLRFSFYLLTHLQHREIASRCR